MKMHWTLSQNVCMIYMAPHTVVRSYFSPETSDARSVCLKLSFLPRFLVQFPKRY
uniref:Uncharacterized protein n=1 Tax=Anguilla anguilla TaxID=7936 RepID=A0A0E9UDS3_ANGAN